MGGWHDCWLTTGLDCTFTKNVTTLDQDFDRLWSVISDSMAQGWTILLFWVTITQHND